jgi:hypothetical protein
MIENKFKNNNNFNFFKNLGTFCRPNWHWVNQWFSTGYFITYPYAWSTVLFFTQFFGDNLPSGY